jgi:hypothetical protein
MVNKYIRLKWLTDYSFVIEHQTKRGIKFGKKDDFFPSSNGVLLYSAIFPAIYRNKETYFGFSPLCFATWGDDKTQDNTVLKLKDDKEKRMLTDAIDEYNWTFCPSKFILDERLFKV